MSEERLSQLDNVCACLLGTRCHMWHWKARPQGCHWCSRTLRCKILMAQSGLQCHSKIQVSMLHIQIPRPALLHSKRCLWGTGVVWWCVEGKSGQQDTHHRLSCLPRSLLALQQQLQRNSSSLQRNHQLAAAAPPSHSIGLRDKSDNSPGLARVCCCCKFLLGTGIHSREQSLQGRNILLGKAARHSHSDIGNLQGKVCK
jgi:hypothetical protein